MVWQLLILGTQLINPALTLLGIDVFSLYISGAKFLCSVLVAPVKNETNEVILFILNFEDISDAPNKEPVPVRNFKNSKHILSFTEIQVAVVVNLFGLKNVFVSCNGLKKEIEIRCFFLFFVFFFQKMYVSFMFYVDNELEAWKYFLGSGYGKQATFLGLVHTKIVLLVANFKISVHNICFRVTE